MFFGTFKTKAYHSAKSLFLLIRKIKSNEKLRRH